MKNPNANERTVFKTNTLCIRSRSGVAPVSSYLVIETRNYLRESFLID